MHHASSTFVQLTGIRFHGQTPSFQSQLHGGIWYEITLVLIGHCCQLGLEATRCKCSKFERDLLSHREIWSTSSIEQVTKRQTWRKMFLVFLRAWDKETWKKCSREESNSRSSDSGLQWSLDKLVSLRNVVLIKPEIRQKVCKEMQWNVLKG